MNRDARFDNIKALLIFLVVLGHSIEYLYGVKGCYGAFRAVIYSFHMPAFVFISGYFASKSKTQLPIVVTKYISTYLIFNTLFALSPWHVNSPMNFLYPQLIYWYLLCLCFWRIGIGTISRIRYAIPMSILFNLYIGTCAKADRFMSISRAICFFTFFLIGYKFSIKWLMKINKKVMALALFTCLMMTIVMYSKQIIPVKMYEYIQSYEATKVGNMAGIEMRAFMMLTALIMTFGIIAIMPSKEYLFTNIGKNSLSIYLLHIFIIKALGQYDILKFDSVAANLAVSVILSAMICAILSAPVFNDIYSKVINKITNALVIPKDLYISSV